MNAVAFNGPLKLESLGQHLHTDIKYNLKCFRISIMQFFNYVMHFSTSIS